mmetsp:Transcript_22325/g.53483  ORF Transcript_22325/g.53483 Transcript_22325/m.53483 type:complete len:360 (-) Transcript_22325:815-1894(-)
MGEEGQQDQYLDGRGGRHPRGRRQQPERRGCGRHQERLDGEGHLPRVGAPLRRPARQGRGVGVRRGQEGGPALLRWARLALVVRGARVPARQQRLLHLLAVAHLDLGAAERRRCQRLVQGQPRRVVARLALRTGSKQCHEPRRLQLHLCPGLHALARRSDGAAARGRRQRHHHVVGQRGARGAARPEVPLLVSRHPAARQRGGGGRHPATARGLCRRASGAGDPRALHAPRDQHGAGRLAALVCAARAGRGAPAAWRRGGDAHAARRAALPDHARRRGGGRGASAAGGGRAQARRRLRVGRRRPVRLGAAGTTARGARASEGQGGRTGRESRRGSGGAGVAARGGRRTRARRAAPRRGP